MFDEEICEQIRLQWQSERPNLDERRRRLWAAAKAQSLPWRGVSIVSIATGMTRDTIRKGIGELKSPEPEWNVGRARKPGGGRKKLTERDPGLLAALQTLLKPSTRASQSPIVWTCKSTKTLAKELNRTGRRLADGTKCPTLDARAVAHLLRNAGFSLRSNRQSIDGGELRNRDAQFEYLNNKIMDFLRRQRPVIVVDTGKWVASGAWRSADMIGSSGHRDQSVFTPVSDPNLDSHFARGFDDFSNGRKWSSCGVAVDTVQLAVRSIRSWWKQAGADRFPRAKNLLIIGDCGGRDNQRTRSWKIALKKFAANTGLILSVCHLPRGTCKLNTIEQQVKSLGRTPSPSQS